MWVFVVFSSFLLYGCVCVFVLLSCFVSFISVSCFLFHSSIASGSAFGLLYFFVVSNFQLIHLFLCVCVFLLSFSFNYTCLHSSDVRDREKHRKKRDKRRARRNTMFVCFSLSLSRFVSSGPSPLFCSNVINFLHTSHRNQFGPWTTDTHTL